MRKRVGHNGRRARADFALAALIVLSVGYVSGQTQERVVTLEEARRLAWLNDPVTVGAESALEIADASRREAFGSFLPSLSMNGIYGNSSNERFDQATGRLVSTSYTAQTNVSYDLFTAGRKLLNYRGATASVAAAEAGLIDARYRTALATTSTFYEVVASAELTTVAQQRLARAKRQLEFANTRLEVGTGTRSDALRAQLEVSNAELALIDAESAQRSARLALGRRIGVEGEVGAAATLLPEQPPALPGVDTLAAWAAASSPLVTSADAAWAASRSSRTSSYTFWVPTLRMTGGYDWFSPTWPPVNRSWNLRITASMPLFNGFQREAAIQRANAAERSAEARAKDARLGARASAIDAAQQIESASRRVAIARHAVDLAREDLRVQEERYQISAATIIELQASQVALAEAESASILARQQLGVAIATLEAVLGREINTN
ncbi:MAG: TolC family protein [Gemmatimonadetes bacterium]|nr:TolC family protein [Gemmatimonadota bacterium]